MCALCVILLMRTRTLPHPVTTSEERQQQVDSNDLSVQRCTIVTLNMGYIRSSRKF